MSAAVKFDFDKFLADVEDGWSKVGFTTKDYWKAADGDIANYVQETTCACAIGAAAFSKSLPVKQYMEQVGMSYPIHDAIVAVNDRSTSKEDALKRLREDAKPEIKRIYDHLSVL
jgi:predicted metal-dependent hydrolase